MVHGDVFAPKVGGFLHTPQAEREGKGHSAYNLCRVLYSAEKGSYSAQGVHGRGLTPAQPVNSTQFPIMSFKGCCYTKAIFGR